MNEPSNIPRKSTGRFQRGNPGGPGRPAGSRNKATLILDAIADQEAEAVLRVVIDAARAGDLKAAEILLSRIWPARKGRPIHVDLPAVATAADVLVGIGGVIDAAGRGDLTPDEAATMAGLLEAKRKAIETVEIERRLAALEDAQGQKP